MLTPPSPERDGSFEALASPIDPVDAPIWNDHPGVVELRIAARLIDSGRPGAALERLTEARRGPIPVELVPHVAVLEGIAAIADGQLDRARSVLEQAWSTHPDVAALPAALGAAQLAAEDAMSAAHSLYAALISDDPDRSLAIHRRRLTPLLAVLRQGAG